MKILVLCAYGRNRSRYIANYLSEKGYITNYDGVLNDEGGIVQKKINEADVIITVNKDVRDLLTEKFNCGGKRIIEIDVDDRPEVVLSTGKQLTGDDWYRFQEEYVYPKLTEQIDKFLPF